MTRTAQFFTGQHGNAKTYTVPLRKAASVAALVTFFLALAAASCPPERAALNTLKDLRATAEHAVAVVKAGRAVTPPIFSDADEAKARDLYAKYLAADKATAEAIYAGLCPDTSSVSAAVADLVAFVSLIQKKGP